MTTINGVPRELLEFLCSNNNNALSRLPELRALLSEQPQAGAGRAEPVVPDAAQWPTTPGIESFQAAYLTKRVWELSAELEALKTQKPVAWGVPNSRITESLLFIELLHSTDGCQCPELLVPLYLAPQPAARHDQGDEVRRLREALEYKVPLYEAVERACGELPEGWAITLQMENGAGWVELYDAEGIQVEDFPTNNERLDYTLNDAIDAALTHSQQGAKE